MTGGMGEKLVDCAAEYARVYLTVSEERSGR